MSRTAGRFVETNAEGHPLRVKLTVEGFRLTEIAAWAQQHLSPGTQVLSDGLACFNGVTAAGCVHEPMVTGGGKAAVERPEWVNTILGNIKTALRGTYHAVRPKYAQRSGGVRVPVQSSLRRTRINIGPANTVLELVGVDTQSNLGQQTIRCNVAHRQVLTLSAVALEQGTSHVPGCTGRWGAGIGKWRIQIVSTRDNLIGSYSLLYTQTGQVTNLSNELPYSEIERLP